MAASEVVIHDRVISVHRRSDITEMMQKQTTVTHEIRMECHEELVECGKLKLCMRNCVIEMIRGY